MNQVRKKAKLSKKLALFPLDSTTITLTSKLLYNSNYHYVKLFGGLNLLSNEVDGIGIYFGQGHDSKLGNKTIEAIPVNGVGIMDRGFASLKRIRELLAFKNRFFVIRINKNYQIKMLENGLYKLGKDYTKSQ